MNFSNSWDNDLPVTKDEFIQLSIEALNDINDHFNTDLRYCNVTEYECDTYDEPPLKYYCSSDNYYVSSKEIGTTCEQDISFNFDFLNYKTPDQRVIRVL